MRYFVKYSNNEIFAVGMGNGGTEITESEYNALLSMILEKASLVDSLYNGEITIDAVPVEWQEEIRRRVDERIATEGKDAEQDIGSEEFMTMLEEVL